MRFLYVFLIFSLGLTNVALAQAKKAVIKKAVIKYESFLTMTFDPVTCEFFEAAFQHSIKTIVIEDPAGIAQLSRRLKMLKTVSNQQSFDVRLKLIIYFNQSTVNYCMNPFGIFTIDYKGKLFENKPLRDFIISRLPDGGE